MRLSSPGPYDDAKKKGGVVGALEEFVYLRRNGNGVDGALASVLKLCAPVDLAIPEVGEISGSYTGSIGEVLGIETDPREGFALSVRVAPGSGSRVQELAPRFDGVRIRVLERQMAQPQ